MVKHLSKVISLIGLFLFFTSTSLAQQDSTDTDDNDNKKPNNKSLKGFHLGLQAGTLFANKYTAGLYNGYGLDASGNQNTFYNSVMYNQIVYNYGGGNGQPDRIAQALNVNPGQWSFDQSCMPINLKYNVSIMVGLNTRYCFDNKNAIILNVNGTKLNVNGNFTIYTSNANTSSSFQGSANVQTFVINGTEQRLMSQLGYQRILGDNDMFNFFVEGGIDLTLAKFLNDRATINNLVIDLTPTYLVNNYGYIRSPHLIGIGVGAFAGLGINLTLSSKYTIQLLYNPSFDKINIGAAPKYTLQQSIGLRAYYNF
ncbi:MAG TPA: hypothetical protein VKG26_10995 [Bacteroidia bacterium]|nr:hypothetical protein [Bacteroidia bacterium]